MDQPRPRSVRRSPKRFSSVLALTALSVAPTMAGCLDRPVEAIDPRTSWTAKFKQTRSGVDKIDLLLMIDNSASMLDKQNILSAAVPNLVKGLLNPPCVGTDNQPIANQPASPAANCPVGSARSFEPILDVHIGIVDSSLGGHGSTSCAANPAHPETLSNNDQGHLVARLDATNPSGAAPTYQGEGFLAWDPKGALNPAGENDLDTTVGKLRDMVKGVGQIGCGYESQLESWYRFLVDPEPYGTIALDANNRVVVNGIDKQLLLERSEFLRPDSMVAILMLTDENDCSTREDQFFPVSNDINTGFRMPHARQECKTDLNDRCCAPCGLEPKECPADPTCQTPLTADEDPDNLRCFNQKKRFGLDFLYPLDRYVTALTSPLIPKRNGDMAQNPLFPSDPTGVLNARAPAGGLVFLAGIIGVPWQDIARQRADGTPDLLAGLDKDGNPVGGFMNAEELEARDPKLKKTRWDVILGDPENGIDPLDPLMRESRDARDGQNPITGAAIAPIDAGPNANPINGHEWNTHANKDGAGNELGDLQYACVFDLPGGAGGNSDCDDPTNGSNNPLCQDATGYHTTQLRAKGYPGLRQLGVLKGIGEQGIVASVCPAQATNPSAADYGYQPAIGAIVERLKKKLTGQCLPRPLQADKNGHVTCSVIEARKNENPGAACCGGVARQPVRSDYAESVKEAQADPVTAGDDCYCEIEQLSGAALSACQENPSPVPVDSSGKPVDGWCYVDDTNGAAALLTGCDEGEHYRVRFVGQGQPAERAITFVTCAGDN